MIETGRGQGAVQNPKLLAAPKELPNFQFVTHLVLQLTPLLLLFFTLTICQQLPRNKESKKCPSNPGRS